MNFIVLVSALALSYYRIKAWTGFFIFARLMHNCWNATSMAGKTGTAL